MYSSKRDFILSLLITLACNVNAFDFSVDGIGYNIIEEDGQKVAQVTQSSYLPDYAGDIVIPSEVSDNGVTYCVTSIDNLSFYRCSEMTSITIPNTVTYIGSEAFWGCSGLTSINIPNSVKMIDSSAFSGCTRLQSIHIPSGVTSIGKYAFYRCNELTSVTSEVVNPPAIDERVFTNSGNATLYVPEESLGAYFSAIGWRDFLSIEAIIELQSYTVTYDASENGTIIVSADGEEIESGASVQEYSTLTISAIPYSDYELESLLVNGEAVDNNSTIIVTEPVHIVATFKPIVVEQTFLITFDEPENGSLLVTKDGSRVANGAMVEENSTLTIVAEPNSGYELESLMVNGVFVENYGSITVTGPVYIEAKFRQIVAEQEFAITFDEPKNGILIVAINGEEIESGTLAKENSVLTVLAISYTDYELEHLTINGNAVNNNCSVPVTNEMNIVATFVPAGMVGVKPYMSGKDKVVKYNLSGQKVVNPTKGLFIINGKKVLIK